MYQGAPLNERVEPKWRNWQTRWLQVPVSFMLVEVQVLSSASKKNPG